ncbi:hypothetical protein GCM10010168_46260 [Actinoplanes ianthinogenes]|uniref:YbaB/EbfC DNA-binding family protein n=1 Tax=Actinoplanes ianthinogenes TaxID=122358 RepID=A0ABM7LP62_9ACTN|nr:YbaB/EbfC family nucleoid-associated protein [Actinoplanes ianthinogenes]BCJ41076.1 hypothetical protein Aiant_17330 [Actinoplanes ianthinogenes]GGR23055.1 hypothetical protein GCM10010168_46260 [Actinoplanes ianthinogenes]
MASNVEPLLEPGMALDRIAAWQHDIDRLVTRTRAMSARLAALRLTLSDPRHLVEVTVDAQGMLMDLRFSARVPHLAPDTLSRTVLSTLAEARRQATDRAVAVITDTVGADSAAIRAMVTGTPEQP